MNFLRPGATALLNGTAIPSTLYVQIHTGDPGPDGTDNVATLDTRQAITRTTAVDGYAESDALVEWLNAPATEDATHVSLWSAASAGTAWLAGELDPSPVSIETGFNVNLAPGDLTITVPIWSP